MKLRKDQRHVAYIILLDAYEKGFNYGFCWAIFTKLNVGGLRYVMLEDLPELMRHKPSHHKAFWFPRNKSGLSKRKSILKECIEKTRDY